MPFVTNRRRALRITGFLGAVAVLAVAAGAESYFYNRDKQALFSPRPSVANAQAAPDSATQQQNAVGSFLPAQITQAPTVAAVETPVVDESALRYFARQGDQKRLEAEIARLRALYPDWTPPADPLLSPPGVDAQLDAIWLLYSQERYAEARQAIAQRQNDEPDWTPPADLIDRLALAEARERLVNASTIDQYETVIRIASENPQLLTCAEVDVLWRLGAAFGNTERFQRSRDVYRYVLTNCDNPKERLATMQNASTVLPRTMVDELMALERTDSAGVGEFEPVRDTVARNAVARGGKDKSETVTQADLSRLERLARDGGQAADAQLLGWYYTQRENHQQAETWFRMALDKEPTADAAEGLALALIARKAYAEAETSLYPWRDASDNSRRVYLAAVANLLGLEPRPTLSPDVLARIVDEVATARDIEAGQQLGWYARAWEQHETAAQWFSTVLRWSPDHEPSAYGLALTRHLLGDTAGLAEIKRQWAGRSDRIEKVGVATTPPAEAPAGANVQPAPVAAAPRATPASEPRNAARAGTAPRAAGAQRSCARSVDPGHLTAEAALQHGWCLMDINRPLEAIQAFEVAARGRSETTRRDAAWGQSLAYLRSELVDQAAVAAIRAPQSPQRARELQTAILSQRAVGAYERGRYVEALIALDQRAQIAPERNDLMVLRGYAYLKLNRVGDAQKVFRAVAATGNRDAKRGLAEVNEMLESAR